MSELRDRRIRTSSLAGGIALTMLWMTGWCCSLSAQAASPGPPLTDEQLAQLRTVTGWRIQYHIRRSEEVLNPSGSGTTTGGLQSISSWSSQQTSSTVLDAVFFVSGSPGCQGRACHVDYSTLGKIALNSTYQFNENLDIDNCPYPGYGVPPGPAGHQSRRITRDINTGALVLDGTPEGNAGVNVGHRFNWAGSFSIDYSANPPRAELFSDIDLGGVTLGTKSETIAGCALNVSTGPTPYWTSEDLNFYFNDNPSYVSAQSGDTQVRVDATGFVIVGSGSRRFDQTPVSCVASSIFGPVYPTSCSHRYSESITWEARPTFISDLSIAGVEVTQATQTLETPIDLEARLLRDDGKPAIPIVAGKPAVLRVYLDHLTKTTPATVDVTVPGRSKETVAMVANGCTPVDFRRQQTVSGGLCRSADVYFTPPEGSWSAAVTLKDGQGRVVETHNLPFKSVSTAPLILSSVPVCDTQAGTDCGTATELAGMLQFIKDTFPGTVTLASSSHQIQQATTTGGWDAWWIPLLNKITALWTTSDLKPAGTYYYGVVRSQLPDPAGGGSIGGGGRTPGNAAAGRTKWQVTDLSGNIVDDAVGVVAHEVGHNLGRQHAPSVTGCYGIPIPKSLDAAWPYPSPYLPSLEVGFNVSIGKAVIPEQHTDWMSYCTPRWITQYTYLALLNGGASALIGPPAAAAAVAGRFWLVAGSIDGGAATLRPTFLFDGTGDLSAGSGDYRIEVRTAAGVVLFTRFFNPAHAHFADQESLPAFSEFVPASSTAARIVVIAPDQTELAARDLVGTPPTVRVLFPAGGERLAGAQTLRWQVQDPDSSTHTYWVQYSADEGRTWRTIAPDLAATQLAVDFGALPGSANGRIRVLASDGVNTGIGTSAAFTVSFKPPTARIVFPGDLTTFRKGQLVWLQAFALDPEDGVLDGASVRWDSNRDGLLGTGTELHQTSLSVGDHRLTVTATDKAGNQATDTITIAVAEITDGGAVPHDTTPPITTLGVSPAANAAGWHRTNVRVTLAAADNAGGSAVHDITVSATGAQSFAAMIVSGGSTAIDITTEGQTIVTFFARDNAGNVEAAHTLTIRVDKTPPAIVATRTPLPNADGWNNTAVTASFLCTDALSGIDTCTPTQQTVTTEGANQFRTATAVDVAGNTSTATVGKINIDTTPPKLACGADPSALWPPNDKLVTVHTMVTVTDGLSGAKGFQLQSATGDEANVARADIVGWMVGAPSVAGQLRATRLGSGTGRIYTLVYQGFDKAGNSATCGATVTVPHDQRVR